ncbi:MAG TPA: type III-B CRISPR module RAMP protein Cmr6 [Candidatus Acidoferrales bacterium]|nr:type III-B CRISPR module RAMP protein Cmr6 [Candidatus Acidoferrales bacterium]
MSIAAVPAYLGKDFSSASPGMRFGMYLAAWEGAGWAKTKNQPLAGAKRLTDNDQKTMHALHMRQQQLFGAIPRTEGLCLDAKSIAPFTTGLGNEHPLENGFAFLNPYGLPYLPGSGVKGVLRQAARELASGDWGDAHGWSAEARFPLLEGPAERRKPVCDKNQQPILLTQTDILFGRETPAGDSEHLRGVLSFWDVIPRLQGDSLAVEIMTPHQNHYYQQKSDRKTGDSTSPHESGQPIPIPFLTVPPGSRFTFCVVCDLPRLRRLAPELAQDDRWKTMLTAAFEHAFEWLGFGAKTAVGYGAMQSPTQRQQREHERAQREAEAKERARQAIEQAQQEQAEPWEGARLKFNSKNGALTTEKNGKSAIAIAPRGKELFDALPAELRSRMASGKPVQVTAYVHGHTLVRIEP